MFNGNKIERNIDLNEINQHKKNENYHYINSHNDGNIIKVNQERNSINSKIIPNNCNYRKMAQSLYEKDQLNIINTRNSSKKHNIPDYLYNVDLNKLSNNNHDKIDISLLSSSSFIYNNNSNNNNPNISNNKEEISPEKYLDDVLKKDEKDIQRNYNKLLVQTLSSDNNLNQNSILTNSIRSDSEFDFFKKTINRNYKVIKEDNINNIQDKVNDKNETTENTNSNNNNKNILNKKISHDDIPIKTYNNFLELVEKELANENNGSKFNNKSFDISSPKNGFSTKKQYLKNNTEGINQYTNEKNIVKDEINEEENIDKNEKENKIIKIIIKKGGKNDKRSKTPDNLIFKRANRKITKNKKITCHENTPNDNLINEENKEDKNNNINDNNLAKPIQQNKINNIINNNSITIISQFDIEEKSIKKPLINKNLLSNKNHKDDYNQRDDSADKDIANYNYNDNDNEFEENKDDIIHKKVEELNNEINKCKEDRNNFNKMKKQYEKLKSKLISDIQILTREKEDFEKYRKNEMEKIKNQKQKYISDNKLIKNLKSENELLNKRVQRDKEIIDSLRSQLSQYQNQNKLNKITNKNNCNNYEFQQLDNNNLSLQQILNKIDLNKYKRKEKEKLFRNKSALEIKYKNSKNNNILNHKQKRMHTSVNEKYETNSKNFHKYLIKQEKSSDKSKSNIKNKINVLTEDNNCQTYESKFYSKRNKSKSIKNSIPLYKNSDNLNILSKDKYLDILKLIGNNSKNKNNKTDYSSSSKKQNLNKYSIKNKKYSFKKKLFPKSKSNICLNNNINLKNKPLTSINSINRKSNRLGSNKNKNLSIDRKDNLLIKDKLVLEDYEFKIPEKYQNKNYTLLKTLETDEKKIKFYTDNKKEVLFPSGVRKEIYNDGYQIVHFVNGDIKQNFPDGKSVYYFNEAKTVQTTFNNGVLVFKFNNDQLERHYPDGKKQILFPDGSERIVLSNGYEETYYSDGRIVKGNTNGQTVTEI